MKTITIQMEDDAYQTLLTFMSFRRMTGNDVGPDFRFIIGILYQIEKEHNEILFTKEWLDK